jgi:hypothetical protein
MEGRGKKDRVIAVIGTSGRAKAFTTEDTKDHKGKPKKHKLIADQR